MNKIDNLQARLERSMGEPGWLAYGRAALAFAAVYVLSGLVIAPVGVLFLFPESIPSYLRWLVLSSVMFGLLVALAWRQWYKRSESAAQRRGL